MHWQTKVQTLKIMNDFVNFSEYTISLKKIKESSEAAKQLKTESSKFAENILQQLRLEGKQQNEDAALIYNGSILAKRIKEITVNQMDQMIAVLKLHEDNISDINEYVKIANSQQ